MKALTRKEPTIIQICDRLEKEGKKPVEDRKLVEQLRSKISGLVSIEHHVHRHVMHVRAKLLERYPKGTLMYLILKDNLPSIREKIDEVSPENEIEKALHDFRTQREAKEFCREYISKLRKSHPRMLQANPAETEEAAARRILVQNIRNTARKWKINPTIFQHVWVHVINELFPETIDALKKENTKNNRKPYNLYVLTSKERKRTRIKV